MAIQLIQLTWTLEVEAIEPTLEYLESISKSDSLKYCISELWEVQSFGSSPSSYLIQLLGGWPEDITMELLQQLGLFNWEVHFATESLVTA